MRTAGRIALVSHSAWLGGAERSLLELVEAVAPRRDVHVVLPGDGELEPRLRAAGATTHLARSRWWAWDPGAPARRVDVRGAGRTARALARIAPDVVVSSTIVQPAGALAAKAIRRPHLWWVHEFGERDHGFRFALGARRTRRAVGALSDGVLTCSEAVRDGLAGEVAPERVEVLRYAVRMPDRPVVPLRARRPGDPLRAVLVGRLRATKGQAEAIDAIALLAAAGRDVRLELVGEGLEEDVAALRAHVAARGMTDRVVLRGATDDPTAALDAADLVLMCSRDEAFGRVTAEALKRERPVVAAASGGTLELVRDGATGLGFAPGDVDALARALARMADDPPLAARLARAGRQHAEALCDPDRLADRFLAAVDRAA